MRKLLTIICCVAMLSCLALGVMKMPQQASAATEGSIAVNAGYAGDQSFYYKTTFSGAITVEYDIEFKCFSSTVFGFGLTPDGNQSNPYSSGLFFANSQKIYTPWRPTGIGSETAYKNYNENYWGVYMYNRVRIKMEVTAAGDVTLYAKSIEPSSTYVGSNAQQTEYVAITDTLTGHFGTELAGDSYMLGFFFRNSADSGETMNFYGFKAVTADGTTIEERFESENMSDKFWTGAIDAALANGSLVYTRGVADPVVREEKELKINGTPLFENNDGYGLPYLYFMMNTSAAQWSQFTDQLANVEYKRADGTVETLNNVVVIDASGKVQIRLAGSGASWELKEDDKFTVKEGFTLVANETLIEKVEQSVSFIYSAKEGRFVAEADYSADKRGAMVIEPAYATDGMMNYNTLLKGAVNVYIDLDVSALNAFGVGFMDKIGDSSPYTSRLYMMSADNAYTPWSTSFIGSPAAYLNGFKMCAGTLKISVNENGDTGVYALVGGEYVQIIDTVSEMYKDYVSNGMYLTMFARTGSSRGYIYKITVTDKNDKVIAKTDFGYDKLNTKTFTFNGSVRADFEGAKTMLSWQEPTGEYIPVPEVEILTGNIESIITEGKEINLMPEIENKQDTDVLTITVSNGTESSELAGETYKFETAGIYTVTYVVTGNDGEVKSSEEKTIIVNVVSTQPTAATNFDQGYFDGKNFEVEGSAGVKDGALTFKTDGKAYFTTKGYSEGFILTFDVTKYVSGEISVVLGKIRDNAYAMTFKKDGTLVFGETAVNLSFNIYEVIEEGKTVTIRVKLFASAAEVYLRAEGMSVENIDIAVARFAGLNITGKAGVSAEVASEFVIDNFRFVSLTSVKGDNTGEPEPQPKPEPDPDPSESSSSSSVEDKGCFGSIAASSLLVPALAVAALVVLKKKKG
mgnify:CR=1 FL=1